MEENEIHHIVFFIITVKKRERRQICISERERERESERERKWINEERLIPQEKKEIFTKACKI